MTHSMSFVIERNPCSGKKGAHGADIDYARLQYRLHTPPKILEVGRLYQRSKLTADKAIMTKL